MDDQAVQVHSAASGESGWPLPGAVRACEACNRKKTKCDMSRPKCGLCQRTGRVCAFPTARKPPRASISRTSSKSQSMQIDLPRLLSFLKNGDVAGLSARPPQQQAPQSPPLSISSLCEGLQDDGRDSSFMSQDGNKLALLFEQSALPPPTSTLESSNFASYSGDSILGPMASDASQARCQDAADTYSAVQGPDYCCVSYDTAMELIELFFAHIQPWLPLLHKPKFIARCQSELGRGLDALAGLPKEFKLLLLGMFSLSSRFATTASLRDDEPLQRVSNYAHAARRAYDDLGNTHTPTLLYLQGCIVLAFHAYTDELSSGAWILTGVCVRLAYDLELSEIDGEYNDSPARQDAYDATDLEEMRRAWWLTWELDTFGSLINRKPFAVDRHHFSVKLPLSDPDWFAQRKIASAELQTTPAYAWKSLQTCENQNPRAWFLIANHLVSLLVQALQRKGAANSETLSELEVAFNCLKLSWPESFDIFVRPPRFEMETYADCNWIMGTHLMLITAYSIFDALESSHVVTRPLASQPGRNFSGTEQVRIVSFSQLVARWPPDYMTAAHPFFICSVLPTGYEIGGQSPERVHALFDSVGETAELIIARFARTWSLAAQVLAVFRSIRGSGNARPVSDLRRRFSAYFTRELAKYPFGSSLANALDSHDHATQQTESAPDSNTLPSLQFGTPAIQPDGTTKSHGPDDRAQNLTIDHNTQSSYMTMPTPTGLFWPGSDLDNCLTSLYPFSDVLGQHSVSDHGDMLG